MRHQKLCLERECQADRGDGGRPIAFVDGGSRQWGQAILARDGPGLAPTHLVPVGLRGPSTVSANVEPVKLQLPLEVSLVTSPMDVVARLGTFLRRNGLDDDAPSCGDRVEGQFWS